MRAVTVDDADELAELEYVVFPENNFNEVTLAREIGRRGAGGLVHVDGEGKFGAYALWKSDGHLVDLLRLGVHPKYQGLGLGDTLLRSVLHECEGRPVMLTVRHDNLRAQQLYLKHGFRIVATVSEAWLMLT